MESRFVIFTDPSRYCWVCMKRRLKITAKWGVMDEFASSLINKTWYGGCYCWLFNSCSVFPAASDSRSDYLPAPDAHHLLLCSSGKFVVLPPGSNQQPWKCRRSISAEQKLISHGKLMWRCLWRKTIMTTKQKDYVIRRWNLCESNKKIRLLQSFSS